MSRRTQELLESIMAGHEMMPDELDKFVNGQVSEDQFLDYKNGEVLNQKKSTPAMMVRKYVSGFANSAGGVLMIGVDEESWTVTGGKAPGGGSLTE